MSNFPELAHPTSIAPETQCARPANPEHAMHAAVADCWGPQVSPRLKPFQLSAELNVFPTIELVDTTAKRRDANPAVRETQSEKGTNQSETRDVIAALGEAQTENGSHQNEALARAAEEIGDMAHKRWTQSTNPVRIDDGDPVQATAMLMFGPDVYQLMGHDTACALTREALVFGFGAANGAANESSKQNFGDLLNRAISNVGMGLGLGAVTELNPPLGITLGAAGTGAWLHHEFGPDNAARNSELSQIANQIWHNTSTETLAESTHRVSGLIGKDAFNTGFDLTAGAVGFEGGRLGAAHVRAELPARNGFAAQMQQKFDHLLRRMDETIDSYRDANTPIKHQGGTGDKVRELGTFIYAHAIKFINACTPVDALKILPDTVRNKELETVLHTFCDNLDQSRAECVRAIFQPVGTASREHVETVIKALSEIPASDLDTMLKKGCKVFAPKEVRTFDPTIARSAYMHLDATHSPSMTAGKRILMPEMRSSEHTEKLVPLTKVVSENLAHEVGHFLEHERDWLAGSIGTAFRADRSTLLRRHPDALDVFGADYLSSPFEITAELYAISLGRSILPERQAQLLLECYSDTWAELWNENWGRSGRER